MMLSNSRRSPGIIMHGKERPHPSGNRGAGIIFFNNEGSENGGLTFSGRTVPDGKVVGGGHLSFDQYEQDQVSQLNQSGYVGKRWAALVVKDRPDGALEFVTAERMSYMPYGHERTAAQTTVRGNSNIGHQHK